MKNAYIATLAFAPSIACAAFAGVLAMHGLEGWGWFLFVACLLGGVSVKNA